ncbi:MAG TPA: MlaD family protein [Burkholderiales bacterium]|nr:MlaD family protein [Burkholderiales bacterium]
MENRAHALAAGLFVLLLGSALAAVALWMQRDTRVLATYFIATTKSVSGLNVEAPVRFRGLDVGKVEAMRLDRTVPGQILIRIGVDASLPLTRATYARLGFQGVTGLAFVQLDEEQSAPSAPLLKPGPGALLPLRPSLMDSGEALLGSVREAADRVNALLDADHRDAVKRALDGVTQATQNTAQLAARLQTSADRLPALLGEAQGVAQRADRLMDGIGALTARLDQRVAALDGFQAAAEHVAAAADRTGSAARAVDQDAMPRLNALLDQLQHETHSVDRLLVMLSDQPQSVVFGRAPAPPGPGEPGFARELSQ